MGVTHYTQTFLQVLDWASAASQVTLPLSEPPGGGAGGGEEEGGGGAGAASSVWPGEGQLAGCVAGAAAASLQPAEGGPGDRPPEPRTRASTLPALLSLPGSTDCSTS